MTNNPSERPNLFNQLRAKIDSPEFQARKKQQTYEQQIVQLTLNVCGATKLAAQLRAERNEGHGDTWLTFENFYRLFPSFPIQLRCWLPSIELHKDRRCIFPTWLGKFRSLPFVAPFNELVKSCESRDGKGKLFRPVGLVFPRKGFRGGLVAHTPLSNVDPDMAEVRYVQRIDGAEHVVSVRPLLPLLNGIKEVWRPG